MATFPPFSDPAQQADMLANPQQQTMTMQPLHQEDLAGIFQVHLRVNPDLPFERQVISQLAEMLFPVLLERYPIGARAMAKDVCEIHGQKGFDQYWPAIVAELETQMKMNAVLMQTQAMQAQLAMAAQGGQQGPSPETQQAVEGGMQAEAQAQIQGAQQQIQQGDLTTQQEQMRLIEQLQKVVAQGQQAQLQIQQMAQQLRQTQEQHQQQMRITDEDARHARQMKERQARARQRQSPNGSKR